MEIHHEEGRQIVKVIQAIGTRVQKQLGKIVQEDSLCLGERCCARAPSRVRDENLVYYARNTRCHDSITLPLPFNLCAPQGPLLYRRLDSIVNIYEGHSTPVAYRL